MQAEMIVLRAVHVLGGIFWVGSALFSAFYLMPALASAGPSAGQVMGALQRRRLFLVLPSVAVLTILSGIRLMQIASFGMAVARPIGVRMGRLAAMPAPATPEEEAARAADRTTLQRRAATAGAINIVLLLGAALAMATARYM
jgi:uncharacterized membrane protein